MYLSSTCSASYHKLVIDICCMGFWKILRYFYILQQYQKFFNESISDDEVYEKIISECHWRPTPRWCLPRLIFIFFFRRKLLRLVKHNRHSSSSTVGSINSVNCVCTILVLERDNCKRREFQTISSTHYFQVSSARSCAIVTIVDSREYPSLLWNTECESESYPRSIRQSQLPSSTYL